MRAIGQLPEENNARRFGNFLSSQGIKYNLEREKDGRWTVWIYVEDQVQPAAAFLRDYENNPHDSRFQTSPPVESSPAQSDSARRKRLSFSSGSTWGISGGIGSVSLLLIGISVAFGIFSNLGEDRGFYRRFLISEYFRGLPEIMHGEYWRLFTPIFVHFGFIHLLFNILALKDLGTIIESRLGSGRLAVLAVVMAPLSNLGQYWSSGPAFGGMSGVLYGLFGYIWIRGRFDPESGLYLDPQIVVMMLAWFVLCFTPALQAANTAHGVGLALGVVWGFLSARVRFL